MANTKITADNIAANAITASSITDGTITAAKLAANSVDSDQYVDGSIDLIHMSVNSIDSDQYVDGSIDTVHIADGAITSAKLDTNIAVGGTLTVTGDANFDSNTLFVDASANAVGIGTSSPTFNVSH
jgi:trimeric autotransporter adhesin